MIAQLHSNHSPVSLRSTRTVLPLVINEDLTKPFKYWNQGVRLGMRYADELYILHQAYATADRLKAYTTGCDLAEQGMIVCITCSSNGYSVWVGLRQPQSSTPQTGCLEKS